jgi:hypothetical protein
LAAVKGLPAPRRISPALVNASLYGDLLGKPPGNPRRKRLPHPQGSRQVRRVGETEALTGAILDLFNHVREISRIAAGGGP